MEFMLLKHLGLQPSEIDRMEFYRIEYLIDHFKEWNEEEKKRQEAEEKKQKSETSSMSSFKKDFDSYKNAYSGSAPKYPNYKI
jgi:hypothetical protein